jgi:outer membrane beta-barrel protein
MKMTRNPRFTKRLLTALAACVGLLAFTETSQAQELYMTGPLAGAPAVRKLRLYRQARFEIAPAVTFTLLDEYQRTIILGGRLQYNFTDWLALGAWGGVGNLITLPTALTDHIQDVNASRRATYDSCQTNPATPGCSSAELDHRLTAVNLGPNLEDQLGVIDWLVAPQLTFTPFRGKLALFQSVYLDTDLYISAGAAFVGVTERKNCEVCVDSFDRASRVAIAPTAAIGFSFYVNKWSAIGWEYRLLPFAWNNSGFDTAGGGKDGDFPDNKITDDDQRFRMNMAMTLSYNILLPTQLKVSE